jgi:hypothetical protein
MFLYFEGVYNIGIIFFREGSMKDMKKVTLGGIAAILILSILSCSSPAELFATATPVPSNTPTKTSTPIPTATPVPPINLFGCLYNDCPTSKLVYDYIGNPVQPNFPRTVNFPWSDTVHFYYSWCTIDRPTLDANLNHIQFVFTINDISYVDVLKGEYFDTTSSQDATQTISCYGLGGVASGWKIGQSHTVKIGVKFTGDINDGWYDYIGGNSQVDTFLMVPSEPATETPLPTPTKTPKPVITYAPPATAAPPKASCQVNSNIIVSNNGDVNATLSLKGPTTFVFIVPPGQSTVRVCSGSYYYYITNGACSSSYFTAKVSDGDQVYWTACK